MGAPQGNTPRLLGKPCLWVTSWESRKDTPDSAEHGSTSWRGSIPLGEAVRNLGAPHDMGVFHGVWEDLMGKP